MRDRPLLASHTHNQTTAALRSQRRVYGASCGSSSATTGAFVRATHPAGKTRPSSATRRCQQPHRTRRGAKPATMRRHIIGASEILQSVCRSMCVNYRDVLGEVGPSDVVYMDPPYQGVSGSRDTRYVAGMLTEEFVLELRSLNERGISFILSYDGRTGSKTYGAPLPSELGLTHIEVDAGRSSSATLLGRDDRTVESDHVPTRRVIWTQPLPRASTQVDVAVRPRLE